MLDDYFEKELKGKKLLLKGNKLTFRRKMGRFLIGDKVRIGSHKAFGGWFTLDWVPDPACESEDIEGFSKREALEIIEKLPVSFLVKHSLFQPWMVASDKDVLIVESDEKGSLIIVHDGWEYFFLTLLRYAETVGQSGRKAYSYASRFLKKNFRRRLLLRKDRENVYKTWQKTWGMNMKRICTKEELFLCLSRYVEKKESK